MREVKLWAVAQGRTLKDWVADCIRQGLGLAPPLMPSASALGDRILVKPNGLPVKCEWTPIWRLSPRLAVFAW